LSHTVISDVQVSGDFAPGDPAVPASRSVQMLLNGVPLGDGNVPEQTHLSFPADASLITAGWQTIGLRAVNQNSAHYTVTDRFTLQMNVSYTGSVCAPATADPQLMQSSPYLCDPSGGGGLNVDLGVVKSASNLLPTLDETLTFTVQVSNNGVTDTTGVVVTDELPEGLTYLSDDSGGTYAAETGVWTVGEVSALDAHTLTVQASIDDSQLGVLITNVATVNFDQLADDALASNNSSTVEIVPVMCVRPPQFASNGEGINVREQPNSTSNFTPMTASDEVGIIGYLTDVNDVVWYRVALHREGALIFGWVNGNVYTYAADCGELPQVSEDGHVVPIPEYNAETECLATILNEEYIYTNSEIAQITNGDTPLVVLQADGRVPLSAESYIVITAIHPNLRYIRIRYYDPTTGELSQDSNHWIWVRPFDASSYNQIQVVSENCLTAANEFDPVKIEDLVELGLNDLPICVVGQFVDCRPTIECDWIFGCNDDGTNQQDAVILHEFGGSIGCNNTICPADPNANPPIRQAACEHWRLLAAQDPNLSHLNLRHCGLDLQTEADIEQGEASARDVYAVAAGHFCEYDDGSGTVKIRVRQGDEVWEYQYTHLGEQNDPVNTTAGTYVAAGNYLGDYDPTKGRTDEAHVHLLIKVFEYVSGAEPCDVGDVVFGEPYRAVDIYNPLNLVHPDFYDYEGS
jgi:uncharacterized repeat protein (TIGR01451 family)